MSGLRNNTSYYRSLHRSTDRNHWYLVHFFNSKRITKTISRLKVAAIYLLSPEDTSETRVNNLIETNNYKTDSLFSAVKGLFWIFVSIVTALAIGQLGN